MWMKFDNIDAVWGCSVYIEKSEKKKKVQKERKLIVMWMNAQWRKINEIKDVSWILCLREIEGEKSLRKVWKEDKLIVMWMNVQWRKIDETKDVSWIFLFERNWKCEEFEKGVKRRWINCYVNECMLCELILMSKEIELFHEGTTWV